MNTKDNSKPLWRIIKTGFSFFIKYLGILAGMGIIGILLLTLVYCLPVNPVSKESSLSHRELMGWAPLVNNRYTQYQSFFTSYEPGTMDDATDLIILNNCFNEGEGAAIERAAYMNDYGRYWHGYVALLRPIFYFMDYWDFLLVNSFLQLFVMGCVGYAIFKATGKKRYLLAFFSSCVFLTPAATAMSLQNTPIFYISMLGSLLCLLKTDWLLQKNRRYYLFLFLGIITCYFDFLTYPLLSFAFPFCWLLVAAGTKIDLKSQLRLLFGGGISFIFGWGGFFATKWLVQTLICGNEILEDGISNVLSHLDNDMPEKYMLLHEHYCKIDTLYSNFRHYLFPLFIVILCAWIGVFLYKFLRGGLLLKAEHIIFVAVTLTSPAWYFILNTHTTFHHLFTHRIYGASLLGFMLFVCGCIGENRKSNPALRIYLKRIIVLLFCFIIGLGASRLAKEDNTIINGGDHTELLLSEGDVLEFEFTPSVDTIKGFSFCIRTNSSLEGDVLIDIYDNDVICATKAIPLAKYEETVFELQLTDWNLQAGKQYLMKVSIKDNTSGIRLLVTPEGDKPQPEYGRAFLNQKQLGDIAPLSGIVYRGHMQTIPIKLYLSVCFGTFLFMWILSLHAYWKNRAVWMK